MGTINDGDSFDTDRLSGSIGYDDENVPEQQQQPPVLDYETIRKDEKKSKKKLDPNEKRLERQREKERKLEEKERKKSQSRTRDRPNRSQARIVMLDDSDAFIDLGVRTEIANQHHRMIF